MQMQMQARLQHWGTSRGMSLILLNQTMPCPCLKMESWEMTSGARGMFLKTTRMWTSAIWYELLFCGSALCRWNRL